MSNFAAMYRDGDTPWESGRPQPAIVALAEEFPERFGGRLLDVGCGLGTLSIYLAGLPSQRDDGTVVAIDPVAHAVEMARTRAAEANKRIEFHIAGVESINQIGLPFDHVVDCLLYHVLGDEIRERYVKDLGQAVRASGYLTILVFSDAEPAGPGPRRITRNELETAMTQHFELEFIRPVRAELDDRRGEFTPDGPHAWLAHYVRHA